MAYRIFLCLLVALPMYAAENTPKVEGTFILGGVDAKLQYVRAARVMLDDKGKPGYAVLLSARPAKDDISAWRTAEPSERGSFISMLLEKNGEIWVAELGHKAAKGGRFGVVTELKAAPFEVRGEHILAHVRTAGEQEFGGDRYSVDVKFEAVLEEKK